MSNSRAFNAMMKLAKHGGPLHFSRDRSRLFARVTHALAQGRPISCEQTAQIIAELGIAPGEARRFLEEWTERDSEGNIVGMGLTLNQTPHQIAVNGERLWAWCAEDTLFYPPVLDQSASIESTSPVSGEPIRVRLSPTRLEAVSPAAAVLTLPLVEPHEADMSSVGAIWSTFCHHSFYFPSPAEAEQWAAGRKDIEIVPVAEGFAIGRQLAARMLS